MKLLVVSHACASPINQDLYAQLERLLGWNLTLVVPSNWVNEYGQRAGGGRSASFTGRLIPIPVWRPGNIILHAYKTSFSALLDEVAPDAIYVHHEPYAVATAQVSFANRRRHVPIGFYSAQNIFKRYPPPFRWSEAMVLRQSRFFFPVSVEVERIFRQKGYTGESAVLPLGIDPATYCRHEDVDAIRRTAATAEGQVLLGYLGRIVQEKGLLTLLGALELIKDLPWRLIVIGSGPLENQFDARAAALGLSGKINRVGFVPHEAAPQYLSAMDALVVPSETQPNWKEQFGRVVIEAMACGTPVLGSNSGEIPNLIADTGGGLVFKEKDPRDLADKLATLIRDPALRTKLAAKGRQAATDHYSLPAIAQKFATTVERAVSRQTGTDDTC